MAPHQIVFTPSADFADAVRRAAAERRIDAGYWDIFHHHHEISLDVQKRILAAIGWNTASTESINKDREREFRERWTSAMPRTLVVGDASRFVPLSLGDGVEGGDITFRFELEHGETVSGSVDWTNLPVVHEVVVGDDHWVTRNLQLPSEIPLGYHQLHITRNGHLLGSGSVIVCPEHAYLPDVLAEERKAGFNVTLYGLRSDRNWGCGDFTDLRVLLDWAHTDVGFSFVGLNPLHALHNRIPYNTSPYLPLSLYYKNLIYIDVEAVPEFAQSRCARAILQAPAMQEKLQGLRAADYVCYQDIARVKKRFLKLLFRQFNRARAQNAERASAFDRYCEREGELLQNFALYCALDEVLHKRNPDLWTWRQWPTEYQNPKSDACAAFAEEHRRLIQFYKFIQFVIEQQLSAAQNYARDIGMPIGLYHDLALATDSCGSDLWAYPEFYVSGCRVGAPPDDFSPGGQDWAFPPPNAEAHSRDGYRLYRESIRKIMEHGGALRIDHVMRLFRLFWISEGGTPADGTYVRDNASDLMHILALESVRARNVVIGEDLGTVTDEIRDMLSRFRILSYRLFYFEKHSHGPFKYSWDYPRQALVASSTHDLATMCGYWTGRDIQARREAGLVDEGGAWHQMQHRNREKQNMLDVLHAERLLPEWYTRNAATVSEIDGELHNAIVGFLARVPSMLLLLNQEDLTKETDQQNLPGSTAEYPNWQRKMRGKLEDLRSTWAPFAGMFKDQLLRNGRVSEPAA